MKNYPTCIASSPVITSAVFLLAAAHIPCIYSVIISLDLPKVTVSNATELPSQPIIRPSPIQKYSLLHDIFSRLCKFHNNSLCPNHHFSLQNKALHQTRPSFNSDFKPNSHESKPDLREPQPKQFASSKPVSEEFVSLTTSIRGKGTSETKDGARAKDVSSAFVSVLLPNVGKRGHFRYNKKVLVYGEDTRTPVFASRMRRYPYSNVVRLSSGCTGTLLTPLHVLTAAHCVHNGEDFRNNLQMLKIEVPHAMGFRVYYVEKISIPTPWLRSGFMGETARSSYDYAVLRLSFGVAGRRRFMPLSVPKANILKQDTYFLAFKSLTDSVLWSSQCHSGSNKVLMDGHLLLTRCDSEVGNSGAAVFTDDPREGKKIIGIVSNTRSIAMSMIYVTRVSIITALTWGKLLEICSVMDSYGQAYGVCPSFNNIPVVANVPVDNRIIPFFG